MYVLIIFLLSYVSSFTESVKGPNQHSVLWNAMIYPFLTMTIKGAIWYQGEANAGTGMLSYTCYVLTWVHIED